MALDVKIKRCHLRYWRQKAGYTQEQLAKIVGISNSRISEYERLERTMSLITAVKISYACHCGLADLYDFEIERQ